MSKRSYRKIRHRADVLVRPPFCALVRAGQKLADIAPDKQDAARAEMKPTAAELRDPDRVAERDMHEAHDAEMQAELDAAYDAEMRAQAEHEHDMAQAQGVEQ